MSGSTRFPHDWRAEVDHRWDEVEGLFTHLPLTQLSPPGTTYRLRHNVLRGTASNADRAG